MSVTKNTNFLKIIPFIICFSAFFRKIISFDIYTNKTFYVEIYLFSSTGAALDALSSTSIAQYGNGDNIDSISTTITGIPGP